MKLSIAAVVKPGTSRANKTGGWRVYRPIIDLEKCDGCGICEMFCPDSCVQGVGKVYEIDYDYCKGCGICAHECTREAIVMVLEEK